MKDARSDSLYEGLRLAGLLDETMQRIMDGEKPAHTVRWLKTEGIASSIGSVYALVRKHGMAWRYEKAQEAAIAEALPADLDAAATAALRRRLVTLTMEASSLKEVQVLSQIEGDQRRLELETRRVKAVETNVSLRVYQAQRSAAEMLEEILSEAATLAEMQRRRAELSTASAADRVEALRVMLYQGKAEPKPTEEAA